MGIPRNPKCGGILDSFAEQGAYFVSPHFGEASPVQLGGDLRYSTTQTNMIIARPVFSTSHQFPLGDKIGLLHYGFDTGAGVSFVNEVGEDGEPAVILDKDSSSETMPCTKT